MSDQALQHVIEDIQHFAGRHGIPPVLVSKFEEWCEKLTAVAADFASERARLEEAVISERQACATLCEQFSDTVGRTNHVAEEAGLVCATLICARGDEESGE